MRATSRTKELKKTGRFKRFLMQARRTSEGKVGEGATVYFTLPRKGRKSL